MGQHLWRGGGKGDGNPVPVLDQLSTALEPAGYAAVSEAIVDQRSLAAVAHEPGFPQGCQLLRYVRLRPVEGGIQMADTGLCARQDVQYLQPNRMRKRSKELSL